MAYLDNTVITVDAVLTKKGRERLGQGSAVDASGQHASGFKITQFAVSDDEIDYSLYNSAHPLGTNYYSNIIESMPVLEAVPDESQTMRYKLTTLSAGLSRLPYINGAGVAADIILVSGGGPGTPAEFTITPETSIKDTTGNTRTDVTLDNTLGYTCILYDEEAAILSVPDIILSNQVPARLDTTSTFYRAPLSADSLVNFSTTAVVAGRAFLIKARDVSQTRNTKITIFGNESGVTSTFNLTVNKIGT